MSFIGKEIDALLTAAANISTIGADDEVCFVSKKRLSELRKAFDDLPARKPKVQDVIRDTSEAELLAAREEQVNVELRYRRTASAKKIKDTFAFPKGRAVFTMPLHAGKTSDTGMFAASFKLTDADCRQIEAHVGLTNTAKPAEARKAVGLGQRFCHMPNGEIRCNTTGAPLPPGAKLLARRPRVRLRGSLGSYPAGTEFAVLSYDGKSVTFHAKDLAPNERTLHTGYTLVGYEVVEPRKATHFVHKASGVVYKVGNETEWYVSGYYTSPHNVPGRNFSKDAVVLLASDPHAMGFFGGRIPLSGIRFNENGAVAAVRSEWDGSWVNAAELCAPPSIDIIKQ